MNLIFQQRPTPVLPEHRPLYKISQILLILFLASRGNRSSLARLHLFNWALKSPDRTARLSAAARSKSLNISAWGFDPALAIAINFACAEELISTSGGGYDLTDKGEALAKEITRDPHTLPGEKEALITIGKGITEGMVEAIAKGWDSK
ncbi:hypothetical protein [Aquipseudomonas guryensis]|uniref:Uncharacterized protein n=1 Tax=Aquipseudomonas guryensis TaxID=2759165 RepID=A0A7W4DCM3_9GAMM|nr:hypothetical protein [Pseudomonas guryensis]MBB1519787.1 hypothetical protein [Pseudomonas guryensis]